MGRVPCRPEKGRAPAALLQTDRETWPPTPAQAERQAAVKAAEVLRVALFAFWQALRRPLKSAQPPPAARFSESRRKALLKLGGACACCGLGMEFGRVLEMHHVNLNGDLHR